MESLERPLGHPPRGVLQRWDRKHELVLREIESAMKKVEGKSKRLIQLYEEVRAIIKDAHTLVYSANKHS